LKKRTNARHFYALETPQWFHETRARQSNSRRRAALQSVLRNRGKEIRLMQIVVVTVEWPGGCEVATFEIED
jgi:hypothetical protein